MTWGQAQRRPGERSETRSGRKRRCSRREYAAPRAPLPPVPQAPSLWIPFPLHLGCFPSDPGPVSAPPLGSRSRRETRDDATRSPRPPGGRAHAGALLRRCCISSSGGGWHASVVVPARGAAVDVDRPPVSAQRARSCALVATPAACCCCPPCPLSPGRSSPPAAPS